MIETVFYRGQDGKLCKARIDHSPSFMDMNDRYREQQERRRLFPSPSADLMAFARLCWIPRDAA